MPVRASVNSGSSSGITSVKLRPTASASLCPISFSAERLRMLILPSASTPMTPALAPASTASVKRRRLSIMIARAHQVVALGAQLLRHLVEGLAELGEVALPAPHRHLHIEIAGRNQIGGADQAADRRDQPVREIEPDPHRRQQHDQRDDGVHQREGDLHADAARLEIGEFRDALLRRLQLLDHARIERARDIEIGVVVAAQLDHRRDALRSPETSRPAARSRRRRRARPAAADGPMSPTPSMSAFSITVRSLCTIRVSGRPRTRRLRGQELAEALAVAVEQRLGAADVERHRGDLAADQRAMLVEIDLRDGERVLDHRLDAGREPGRKPAVERDAGDDRDQHRGNGGDHREQPDDAHMQPRARPSAPARLHDLPDFPADDADQQQRRAQRRPSRTVTTT